MMKVCIRETLERVVDVESVEEAECMYKRCEIVLDADDYVDTEFIELKEE